MPDYMVLRFNLSVSNAYKGLLLGTGPIIDPGFDGNLFIPLHNLTGNEYIIKRGAPLIRVEFTKLSRHPIWNNKKTYVFPFVGPITKETPAYENFSRSIRDALLDSDKKQFYTKGDVISVRSSIPDAIANSAKKAKDAQESASEAEKSAKTMRNWSVFGIITTVVTVVIAAAGILLTSYSLIQDANARYDGIIQELDTCKQQICALTEQLEITRKQLEQYETVQPIDPKQAIIAEISGETVSLPSLPSGEAGGDDGP